MNRRKFITSMSLLMVGLVLPIKFANLPCVRRKQYKITPRPAFIGGYEKERTIRYPMTFQVEE